jgi:two-component system CheB/CheR fusion protein
MTESSDVSLSDLLQELADERGVDFRGYKRSTIERRLRRRMFQLKQKDFAEYRDYLRKTPAEVDELLKTILINVTEFFRDPGSWEFLRRRVLPGLLRRHNAGESIRAWSAGCATGEEAYSVAITLCEHFGKNTGDYDIKIYATDMDEDALNLARRAEYTERQLRHVRPEWREKYFQKESNGNYRVVRDLRKLVIFGRSNLATDAPISHVELLVCRNVLIYFSVPLQSQILLRLHYALEPHGVLFLGTAESLVTHADLFESVYPKWRIFRRTANPDAEVQLQRTLGWVSGRPRVEIEAQGRVRENETRRELATLKSYQSSLLETLKPGVLVLDLRNTITIHNEAALTLFGVSERLTGKRLEETEIAGRTPEIRRALAQANGDHQPVRLNVKVPDGDNQRVLEVTIKPVMQDGQRSGALIYVEDVSHRHELQQTIQQLETTSNELQSTNEELEATNEELQSTNEELETINEELQSANEELETTNEELQSLNEELATTNEELQMRSRDLDLLNNRYAETLEQIPWPVMLVDDQLKIHFWNTQAQQLFGFNSKPSTDLVVQQLPVAEEVRKLIARRVTEAQNKEKGSSAQFESLGDGPASGSVQIDFTPLKSGGASKSVLVMFQPLEAGAAISARKVHSQPVKKAGRRLAR